MGSIRRKDRPGEPPGGAADLRGTRVPVVTAEVAAHLTERLKGEGCSAGYVADRIGCNNHEAGAWMRSIGAAPRSRTSHTIWGFPDPARVRASILRQSKAGTFGGSGWQGNSPRDWHC